MVVFRHAMKNALIPVVTAVGGLSAFVGDSGRNGMRQLVPTGDDDKGICRDRADRATARGHLAAAGSAP